tara:strand:- start:595 stop:1401 length:807 start_codon:yes stop_codon:yes gene_type:complete
MKFEKKISDFIINWLKKYNVDNKMNGYVVGVSGGVDSALTSSLCAMTGLPLLCLEMDIYQKKDEKNRAVNHIKNLKKRYSNVDFKSIELTNTFDIFQKSVGSENENDNRLHSLANTRSRLRMITLYYFASIYNYLVVGTGNKVEDFGIGFYTKYGDGGVDLSPIADLMKSEVFQVAKYLGVSNEILNAQPTDGLWSDNRTDNDQIGATYEELEWAMRVENKEKYNPKSNREREILSIYNKFNNMNKHKMIPIPICLIPRKFKSLSTND